MNATSHPAPELHLPDLPEVSLGPVSLGPGSAQGRRPWAARWRDGLSSYLPLLLMALLASSTWWLVKHTPGIEGPATAKPVRSDPDYTMRGFKLTRFAPDGRFAVRIEGEVLRHYPDTDRLEIDGVRIESVSPDGRITRATARRALCRRARRSGWSGQMKDSRRWPSARNLAPVIHSSWRASFCMPSCASSNCARTCPWWCGDPAA